MPVPPLFRSAVLLLLVAGCGGPRPAAPSAPAGAPAPVFAVQPPPTWTVDGLRVATLNGEFLFDGEGDEGEATFDWKGDPAAARAHRDGIARIIRMLDADVVMIPETENLGVLERMIAESLADLGYTPHLVPGLDRFTGQNLGLLSRVPVEAVGRINETVPVGVTDQRYGVSKNLWARVTLLGRPTTLVGVHFLAQPDNPERRPRREAQAEVIRAFVAQEAAAGREVVVLGDFNDFDDAIRDRNHSRPISDVLAIVKRAGDGPADDLVNVLGDVPQAERFTSLYDRNNNDQIEEGELSAIDHILLSPGLYRLVRDVRYVHSHDPREVTDHFPVVVTLAE